MKISLRLICLLFVFQVNIFLLCFKGWLFMRLPKRFLSLLIAIFIVSFLYVEISLIIGRDIYYVWLGLIVAFIFLFFLKFKNG